MLTAVLKRREPDADFTSFGMLTPGLFIFGTVVALRRWREPTARLVLGWSAGVLVFLVFFHAMQQWHPYGFR